MAANLFSHQEAPPPSLHPLDESSGDTILGQATYTTNGLLSELPAQQQKQLLASIKINDPSSLLRELLKHRHNATSSNKAPSGPQTASSGLSFRNKFSCYSSSSADVDEEGEQEPAGGQLDDESVLEAEPNENNHSMSNSTPIKRPITNSTLRPREPSFNTGRNLINSLNEVG